MPPDWRVKRRVCMDTGFRRPAWIFGAAGWAAAVALVGLSLSEQRATGQTANRTSYKAPRTADGRPNLNGLWQALTPANWDIQDHAAKAGPVVAMGALG